MDAKVDLLVTRKLSSFDLTSVAVPHSFDPDAVSSVVAAVGGGDHSPLAAEVATSVARSLGIPATLATVYRPQEQAVAEQRLDHMAESLPGVKTEAIEANSVRALLDDVDKHTLLVVGAPGGSWLNRQLFGPGHRLISRSEGGTITVRFAERRVYHEAIDANGIAVGADIAASTLSSLIRYSVVPVADHGLLVGILRRSQIEEAEPGTVARDIMEDPVSLLPDEPLAAALDLADHMEGCPIPITDGEGRLVGLLPAGGTMSADGELGLPG